MPGPGTQSSFNLLGSGFEAIEYAISFFLLYFCSYLPGSGLSFCLLLKNFLSSLENDIDGAVFRIIVE